MHYEILILLIFSYLFTITTNVDGDKMMHGKFTKSISDYYLSIPHKLTRSGHFATFKLPNYYEFRSKFQNKFKKRSIKNNQEVVHYGIPIDGTLYHAILKPNRNFIDSNLIIEKRNPTISVNNRQLKGIENKKLCYYTGRIKGDPNSRVVLSTCDGLMGSIRLNNKYYHIEPVDKHKRNDKGQLLHIVYSPGQLDKYLCGGPMFEAKVKQNQKYKTNLNRRRSKRHVFVSKQKYIETLIVADKAFLKYYANKDWDLYILNAMNMAADIYHDVTIGNAIDLILVRVIYLEKEEEEIDLQITKNVGETLASFGKWAEKINTPIDSPNHHDLAVLITRVDVCNEDGCGNTGLATFLGICKVNVSAGVAEDRGLSIGHVLAHEIGHTLGCDHDGLANSCSKTAPDGTSYVMATGSTLNAHSWSPCSREAITKTLLGNVVKCLDDRPTSQMYKYTNNMPGVLYNADEQCSFVLRDSPGVCSPKIQDICKRLLCYTTAKKCVGPFPEAAPGTHCGSNKWCFNGECTEVGERPKAINGGWNDWSEWSDCSRTCGAGISYQERICNNPAPSNGGRFCIGDKMKVKLCNTHSCGDNVPTYRETQCAAEDDRFEFNGKYYKWTPIPITNEERACSLICKNGEGAVVLLQPLVKDGTLCRPGTRDVCINGQCMEVGCDYQLNSGVVEDRCGVCNGDGTQCKFIKDMFNEPAKGARFKTIASIPAGARKIRIAEEIDSPNHITVQDAAKKTYFLNKDGKGTTYPGELTIAGSKAVYKLLPNDKEELLIEGPIKEDIVILYSYFEQKNGGVTYQWAESIVDNTYEPKYSWEIGEYTECDVACGGGIQEPNWMCIEQKSGKVSESFCSGLEKPKAQNSIKKCNQQPCKTRWKVGPWSKCKACKNKSGVRIRVVQCVKENPRRNSDDIIEENSECKELKPGSIELCEASHKCSRKKRSYFHIPKKHQENIWKQMHLIFKKDCRITEKDYDDINGTTTISNTAFSTKSTFEMSVSQEPNSQTLLNENYSETTAIESEETEKIDLFESSTEHSTSNIESQQEGSFETPSRQEITEAPITLFEETSEISSAHEILESSSEESGTAETALEHGPSEIPSQETSSFKESYSDYEASSSSKEAINTIESSSEYEASENTSEETVYSQSSLESISSESPSDETAATETLSESELHENASTEDKSLESSPEESAILKSEFDTSETSSEAGTYFEASAESEMYQSSSEDLITSELETSDAYSKEISSIQTWSTEESSESSSKGTSFSESSSEHETIQSSSYRETGSSELFFEHETSETFSESTTYEISESQTSEETNYSEISTEPETPQSFSEETNVSELSSKYETEVPSSEEFSTLETSSAFENSENTPEETSVISTDNVAHSFESTASHEILEETRSSTELETESSETESIKSASETITSSEILTEINLEQKTEVSPVAIPENVISSNILQEGNFSTNPLTEKPLLALISDETINDSICKECDNADSVAESESSLQQVTPSEVPLSQLISKAILNKPVSEALSSKSFSELIEESKRVGGSLALQRDNLKSTALSGENNRQFPPPGVIKSNALSLEDANKENPNGVMISKESLAGIISEPQLNELLPQPAHEIVERLSNDNNNNLLKISNDERPSCGLSSTEVDVIKDYVPLDQLELVFIDQITESNNLSDDAFARFGQDHVEGVELSTLKVTGKQFIEYEQRLMGTTNVISNDVTTKKSKRNREIILLDYY